MLIRLHNYSRFTCSRFWKKKLFVCDNVNLYWLRTETSIIKKKTKEVQGHNLGAYIYWYIVLKIFYLCFGFFSDAISKHIAYSHSLILLSIAYQVCVTVKKRIKNLFSLSKFLIFNTSKLVGFGVIMDSWIL